MRLAGAGLVVLELADWPASGGPQFLVTVRPGRRMVRADQWLRAAAGKRAPGRAGDLIVGP